KHHSSKHNHAGTRIEVHVHSRKRRAQIRQEQTETGKNAAKQQKEVSGRNSKIEHGFTRIGSSVRCRSLRRLPPADPASDTSLRPPPAESLSARKPGSRVRSPS